MIMGAVPGHSARHDSLGLRASRLLGLPVRRAKTVDSIAGAGPLENPSARSSRALGGTPLDLRVLLAGLQSETHLFGDARPVQPRDEVQLDPVAVQHADGQQLDGLAGTRADRFDVTDMTTSSV